MKKYIIAIIIAVVILLIGGCMRQASAADNGCVTKSEWTHRHGAVSPHAMSRRFGAHGTVVKQRLETIPYYIEDADGNPSFRYETDLSVTLRYNKCGSWGKHDFVKVWYITWWETPERKNYSEVDGFNTMVKYRTAS